jgi:hypothetical protein
MSGYLKLAALWLELCSAGIWLLGITVPKHVQTSDYFNATTRAPAPIAAAWLTWAETDIKESLALRPLGVKTMLYTDPNRAMSGRQQPEYTSNESTFAHDCSGARIETTTRPGQYLMDPESPALLAVWKYHADRYGKAGKFDAIFEDDANGLRYVTALPCHYNAQDWLAAIIAMQRDLGWPIIYNALSNFSDRSVSPSIALNATAIGGMMEECYAPATSQPKSPFPHWVVTEETELQMAAAHKLFFCYGNDISPAAASIDNRLYVYASFLLTYDLSSSVLWEYYEGPTYVHIMPEAELVALQPSRSVQSVKDLLAPSGVYTRAYGACYLAGRSVGPCVAAVNPDATPHALDLPGYHHTLALSGGGVLYGGSVSVDGPAPPAQLSALSALIAFR